MSRKKDEPALEDDLEDLDDLDPDALEDLDDTYGDGGMSGRTGFLSGLLLGTLIGAGVALLVAPERGDVTRRRLTRGVRQLADDTREQVEDWADDAKKELRRQRRRMRKRLRR